MLAFATSYFGINASPASPDKIYFPNSITIRQQGEKHAGKQGDICSGIKLNMQGEPRLSGVACQGLEDDGPAHAPKSS
jgi:hypothetical protein